MVTVAQQRECTALNVKMVKTVNSVLRTFYQDFKSSYSND